MPKVTYHIVHGTVSFYVDDVWQGEEKFTTTYKRKEIINAFIKRTQHIAHRLNCYYVISIDEESVAKKARLKKVDYEKLINEIARTQKITENSLYYKKHSVI